MNAPSLIHKRFLRERWMLFIHHVATGSRKYRMIWTPIGATVFLSFFAIAIALSLATDRYFNFPILLSHPLNDLAGATLILIGLSLTLWSIVHFVRVKGTPVPLNPPPVLVQNGPYAYARNPMLTGVFLIYFGAGFDLGSASMVFLYTPLFILLNYWELKNIEEPELEKRLGRDYVNYKNRTPMFCPKFKNR